MADIKISQLPAASALGAADTFEVVQAGANRKATGAQVAALTPRGYIDGLSMEWVSGTSLRVTSGAAFIPGRGSALELPSAVTKSGLSLAADTWYHVYLFDNAGNADVEVVTTAPAAPYIGTARAKSGDNTRRYIGSVVTDASGAMYSFSMSGNSVLYGGDSVVYPKLRVLSNGTAPDWTTFSFADVVPVTARILTLALVNTGTAAFRVRPTFGAWTGTSRLYGLTAGVTSIVPFQVDSNLQGAYQCVSGGIGVVDVSGYTVER